MLKALSDAAERLWGIRVTRVESERRSRLADLSPEIQAAIDLAAPYTMTSIERLATLCMAVEHTVTNNVPGAFVECGVWKGGSSMVAAYTYSRLKRQDVDMFLFDTFEGMSEPSKEDVHASSGKSALQLLEGNGRDAEVWAYAPITEVKKNLQETGYPIEKLHFVKGKVEETLPQHAPAQISILRLDTDWYDSTKHELEHLFPRLSNNGILIIDDYGAWTGARKAVDEYFANLGQKPFLSRIDTTGRLYLKTGGIGRQENSVTA